MKAATALGTPLAPVSPTPPTAVVIDPLSTPTAAVGSPPVPTRESVAEVPPPSAGSIGVDSTPPATSVGLPTAGSITEENPSPCAVRKKGGGLSGNRRRD